MNPYDIYAPIYDGIMGDRASWIIQVRSLIQNHHPKAKEVLELACGTGSILKGLRKDYKVSGVDYSAAMLKIAKSKLPGTPFIKQDITKLKLAKKFDVIFLIFDSMNHLPNFKSWCQCIQKAAEHLKENGIFIFDINTPQKLEAFAKEPAYASQFGKDFAITHLVKRSAEHFDWHVNGFHHISGNNYRKISLKIAESTYKVSDLKKELKRHFSNINVSDWEHLEGEPRSHRLWFVCHNISRAWD